MTMSPLTPLRTGHEAREQKRNKPRSTGPHRTNQTHRFRAQNAPARAQWHGSELWSPVRDEEAAGSNPVTPTSVSAGERPCPIRGGVFALPRTATKYRNSAHRRDSPSLRSASLVAVELALA